MKVQIIKSAGGPDGTFKAGQIRDLPDTLALQLIKDGIATAAATKPEASADRADSAKAKKRDKR